MKAIIKNDLTGKYSKGIMMIHWLSLLLIIALIPIGFIMSGMENQPGKLMLYKIHVALGLAIFLLTLIRIWFFFKHKRPSKLETGSRFHNRLVIGVEYSFYWILILLCISGLATIVSGNLANAIRTSDFTLLPKKIEVPPLAAHQILVKLLMALLIAHIIGVTNHYIRHRENTLQRILP